MTLHWTKEDTPRWDAEKQRLFGPAELAAVGLQAPEPGTAIADEWWRVTDDVGSTVGCGWLDTEWGDAQITFFVAPSCRQAGIGEYIVGRLEAEAADRGVNYIYNVIPDSHPDPGWMKRWLAKRGFVPGTGDLRRQVAYEDALAPRDRLRHRGSAAEAPAAALSLALGSSPDTSLTRVHSITASADHFACRATSERPVWAVANRYIAVGTTMATSVPDVFTSGDITEYHGKVRLISVGFGEAAIAVNNAAGLIRPDEQLFLGHSSDAPPPTVTAAA